MPFLINPNLFLYNDCADKQNVFSIQDVCVTSYLELHVAWKRRFLFVIEKLKHRIKFILVGNLFNLFILHKYYK